MDYDKLDAIGMSRLVARKEITASELLDEALTRADTAQDAFNCFTHIFEDRARKQIADGLPQSELSGVPFATKDLAIAVSGVELTGGSRLFKGYVPDVSSELVSRYEAAGIVVFAQTTSPEYGLTTSTESALYGQTKNPWDVTRTSGGSSGGASACVAAGVIPMAQASDGGGSIRIPAACTGLFGMKPSRGRIPMGPGRTENWNGLSTVHAVSRSVRDNAALMDLTHGPEIGSRYHAPDPLTSFLSSSKMNPGPLSVAVWETAPNGTRPDADAQAGLDATVLLLESLGHKVTRDAPAVDGEALSKGLLMVISAHVAALVEARLQLLQRKLRDEDLETVTRAMLELGKTVPMLEMAKADAAFMQAAHDYQVWMDAGLYDVVLMPTLSRKPDKLGVLNLSPDDMDAYTKAVGSFAPHCAFFNQIGAPAMSVPLHWTDDGLPLGMMFGARYGEAGLLYSLAGQLEDAQPWAHRRPG